MKLLSIVLVLVLEDMSSISKQVPPVTHETSSPSTQDVYFAKVEHESGDVKEHDEKKYKAYYCKPCNYALCDVLRTYVQSSGYVGHVDFAIKKVTE